MFSAVKDAVLSRAMRLMGDPRLTKVMTDQRVISAAMRAMSVGERVKGEVDKVARTAAGALGWATATEVNDLRSTITSLQETIVQLENRAVTAESRAAAAVAPPPPAPAPTPALVAAPEKAVAKKPSDKLGDKGNGNSNKTSAKG